MQHRTLGRTGLKVSRVGFGGAVVGIGNYIEKWDPHDPTTQRQVERALDRALDLGLNYLDTAEGYGEGISETIMGRVIGRRREECVVATKVSSRDPARIRQSCEASLRRLQTDVIDVYQFHGGWYDPDDVTAILDRGGLETMQALRDEGKVRFIGFTAEAPTGGVSQLIATHAFDVLQVRYNVMYQHACDYVNRRGVMLEAKAQDMGVVIMRPLTSGTFQRLMEAVLPGIEQTLDLHRMQLAYVLSNPNVDVAIVGMRRAEEVEANNAVADDESYRFDLEALHHRFIDDNLRPVIPAPPDKRGERHT
jgi:aryl-alcohol dehydrogenase-like predicted oxidoreductase